MRLVLIAFPLLCAGVALNLFLLQPRAGRLATVAVITPREGGPQDAAAATKLAAPLPPVAQPAAPVSTADTVRAIRRELHAQGYEAGAPDGTPDIILKAAILAYEYDHGLALTAEPSEQLLKAILLNGPSTGGASARRAARTTTVGPGAAQLIRHVQEALARLGYITAKPDGRWSEDLAHAIRDFEIDQNLPETGRISGQLVARLARPPARNRAAARH